MLNPFATTGGATGAAVAGTGGPENPPRKGGGGSFAHLTRLLQITTCVIVVSFITAASLATYGGGGGGGGDCARSAGGGTSNGAKLLQLLPRLMGPPQSDHDSHDHDTDSDANPLLDRDIDTDGNERFLIIAGVTEQLGKAIYHMEDLFELCILSNRTCVLPGIAGGQFALDGALSFGDIFDLRSLPPSLRTVQWDRFARYFRRRFGSALGQGVSSEGSVSPPPNITMCALGKEIVSERMVTAFQRTAQYYQPSATFAMDPACETAMIGFPADRQQQAANLESVMSVLGGGQAGGGGGQADGGGEDGRNVGGDEDDDVGAATRPTHHPPPPKIVAIFHYEWSEPLPRAKHLPSAGYAGLDFSARFYEQAMAFRAQVGDYIHLQWRMEKADGGKSTNYTACALAAIRHIKQLSERTGVNRVYFSSDLGRDGVPWSNSFAGVVPKDALHALTLIYDEFPNLLTWLNVTSPMLPRYDMAAVGVMDRLIAMGSTYFVRGPKECSRVGAYVQSIGKWRKKRLEAARDGGGSGGGDGAEGGTTSEGNHSRDSDEFGSRIMNEADEFAL